MTKKKEQKPLDEIRETILHFFYDTHKKASSPKKVRLKILEAKSGLKELGLSGNEVVSNMEYLIDGGWLSRETEQKEFTTPKGVKVPSETHLYKASNKTIDHFDKGKSIFMKQDGSGINITNIQGVTTLTVGDNNDVVVNAELSDLWSKLEDFNKSIREGKLSDEDKLNYTSEIKTIQTQLQKQKPDKSIISKAWDNLKNLASGAETLSTIYSTISPIIKALIGI